MKSTKYDIFLIKINEILIFESGDFSSCLTEGEVKKEEKRRKCQVSKINISSILIKICHNLYFSYVFFYEF